MTNFSKKWLISSLAFLSNRPQWLVGSLNQEARWHWRTGNYSVGGSGTTGNIIYYIFLDRLRPGQAFGRSNGGNSPSKQANKQPYKQTNRLCLLFIQMKCITKCVAQSLPVSTISATTPFPRLPAHTRSKAFKRHRMQNINFERHLIKKRGTERELRKCHHKWGNTGGKMK